jgi:threonine/homoserine/homoserine lactone efflux protein
MVEDIGFWFIYAVSVFVVSIIPGPSMILALTHGLKHGVKLSFYTALGNTLASVIQASIAIMGLGIILTTSTILFMIIKYLGALYLIYLGVKLCKTSFSIKSMSLQKTVKKRELFTEAFIVAASNPKALIFFTAFFPQFLQGTQNTMHNVLLIVVLGLVAFLCMMIYSSSANFIKRVFNETSLSKYFGKLIGSIFISFGFALALSKK